MRSATIVFLHWMHTVSECELTAFAFQSAEEIGVSLSALPISGEVLIQSKELQLRRTRYLI